MKNKKHEAIAKLIGLLLGLLLALAIMAPTMARLWRVYNIQQLQQQYER